MTKKKAKAPASRRSEPAVDDQGSDAEAPSDIPASQPTIAQANPSKETGTRPKSPTSVPTQATVSDTEVTPRSQKRTVSRSALRSSAKKMDAGNKSPVASSAAEGGTKTPGSHHSMTTRSSTKSSDKKMDESASPDMFAPTPQSQKSQKGSIFVSSASRRLLFVDETADSGSNTSPAKK